VGAGNCVSDGVKFAVRGMDRGEEGGGSQRNRRRPSVRLTVDADASAAAAAATRFPSASGQPPRRTASRGGRNFLSRRIHFCKGAPVGCKFLNQLQCYNPLKILEVFHFGGGIFHL